MTQNVFENWPTWLSRWLGYRSSNASPSSTTNYVVWIWSFIGAFGGLSVIQAVFTNAEYFVRRKVPQIVGSYVSILKMVSIFRQAYLLLEGCFCRTRLRSARVTPCPTASTPWRSLYCIVNRRINNKTFLLASQRAKIR